MEQGLPPFRVELSISDHPLLGQQLLAIDSPRPGSSTHAFSVEFTGFLIKKKDSSIPKARKLTVQSRGKVMHVIPIEIARRDLLSSGLVDNIDPTDIICGFSSIIPTFLSRGFSSLDVFVEHETVGDSHLEPYKIAAINFIPSQTTQSALANADNAIGIVSINSIGRSGSTLLARILGSGPDCFCPIFMGQFGELSIVDSYLRAIATLSTEGAPNGVNKLESHDDFLTLRPAFLKPDPSMGDLGKEFHSRIMEATTRNSLKLFSEVIEQITEYTKLSKPEAKYWVEKQWVSVASNLMEAMLPRWKEIILVRDIRDFWRSQYRFLDKLQLPEDAKKSHVEATIGKYQVLHRTFVDRKSSCLLVKYEDLVGRSEKTLRRVFEYLDLDVSESQLEKFSSLITSDDNHARESRSIGFAEDPSHAFEAMLDSLSPPVRNILNSNLAELGYDPL